MPVAPVRVLCVEDNELVADALARKLTRDPDFEWLGWVRDSVELMRVTTDRNPHVVCMDLDVPGQDTLGMIRQLAEQAPNTRVLILTGHLREDLVNKAVDAGAWGYLSKAEDSRVIVDSIKRVAAGEFVLGRLTLAEFHPSLRGRQTTTPPVPPRAGSR